MIFSDRPTGGVYRIFFAPTQPFGRAHQFIYT